MKRRTVIRVLAASTMAGLAPVRALAADELIRVTTIPADSSLEVNYAQAAGIATQMQINATVDMGSNGAAIMAAVAGGATDIGISNLGSLLTGREKGIPIVIIAAAALYNSARPSSVLMVPNDSPLKTARDLNGKVIATDGLGNMAQFGPQAWVDKNGGDSKSIRWVEIPFIDMPIAFAGHRIDAGFLAEPNATRAKSYARVFGNAYDGIANRFLITAWFSSAAWAAANPDLAARFAAMVYKTGIWANANLSASGEVLARVAHIDSALIGGMNRATFSERADPSMIKPVIDAALRYGAISKPVNPVDMFAPQVRR
jgi:NitT/TauT family transport system substrate-binding protein